MAETENPASAEEKHQDMRELESEIRAVTVEQAQATLRRLVETLSQPETVARALHLIEETARQYSQILATLGVPGARPKRRVPMYQIADQGSLGGYSDDSNVVSGGGNGDVETFGNRALGQLMGAFKPLIQTLLTRASTPIEKGPSVVDGLRVESLTRALSTAKSEHLPERIIWGIEDNLKMALGLSSEYAAAEPQSPSAEPEKSADATAVEVQP